MHFLAILDYGRPCDLASEVDGENGETMSATLGCVLLPGFSAGTGPFQAALKAITARTECRHI